MTRRLRVTLRVGWFTVVMITASAIAVLWVIKQLARHVSADAACVTGYPPGRGQTTASALARTSEAVSGVRKSATSGETIIR